MNKLDLNLLKQSIALAKPYWFSEENRKGRWLLVLLVLLLIGDTEFNVLFNQQSGEFTSALAARDTARFWHSVRIFFGLLLAAVPIYAYYYYVRDTLGLNWRRWLTDRILKRYFKNHAFYKLLTKPEIDNPDQRISQDIASFTQQALSFLLIFGGGVIQLLAFGRVLWSISGYLVLFVIVYATLVTLVTFGVFSGKLVSLNFNQRRREADFRFGLVRIRENAESIALYHGEGQEQAQVQRLFGQLFANFTNLIRWQLRLNFFQYPQSLLLLMLPSMVIAPRVLSGELEVGRIVQAEGAFAAIMSALTILVDNVESLSLFAAGVSRVSALAHSLVPAKPSTDPAHRKIVTREGEHLRIDDITLQTPNYERTLVKELTLSVPSGEGLMIVGASGLGKSSLLRMIAGLWDSGTGTIERPKLDDILFLPQAAYMIIGSLRDQLLYPNLERSVSDAELREVLDRVNLPDLVDRCGGFDVEFDFEKILSVGERQRLAFARVLLKHPRYVLLDEATSALDRENESSLYRQLIATSTTFVSVSHHPALVKHHSQVLELTADGGWHLQSAAEFRFTQDLA
ncbi:MAG TPA: ABC transporter ATP-binding protein/permease [Bryobacteraceae bacterium]|nr:ABC transporter ATP-binding protein/permease [Bryobacteraceae bacterium]